MKAWMLNNTLLLVGLFTGTLAGFLYWKFIGCSSGTCMITSKPLNSSLYGAVLGSLIFSLFDKKKMKSPLDSK